MIENIPLPPSKGDLGTALFILTVRDLGTALSILPVRDLGTALPIPPLKGVRGMSSRESYKSQKSQFRSKK
jgi:hypothetical protein